MTKSPETEHPIKAYGYAATVASGIFSPLTFSRRVTGDKDVRFKVLYCGICHSDLHFAKNEWGVTTCSRVFGSFVLRIQVFFKGALVGGKSRFSLNLAR
ncbi:hypothetical protein L6452_43711 [Arctium lappa]|uniref:Uncharacterized protein n=1 Tax=Arctium lappa TaxID=4217 RepID=A0ACB8XED2_ARCLA|nr:hypothetical protein L6452_43711 [Arctium lappa]